jgi:hypothetical protein
MAPPLLPHILEISLANGKPWVNPAFDTSDPNWASNVVGGKTFDGSSQHPFEWVSVLNPKVEQDDQVGVSGTALGPDDSKDDIPFTHPFGPFDKDFGSDFEFSLAPDPAYVSLLAPANRDRDPKTGQYAKDWPLAHQLGLDPPGMLGVEVDRAIVPVADRVNPGDRVAVFGRWIVDAAHPPYHTEIHPPLLMAHARCVDSLGNPTAPTEDAITHVQFWSRPYQAAQKFNTGGDTGLCLRDYIPRIAETVFGSVEAYPPIHDKPFKGVHLVAFTVRPPLEQAPSSTVVGAVNAMQRRLECSYHFTVNGSCSIEVSTSLAGPNAVLVIFALTDANYPKLPHPKNHMQKVSMNKLMDDAKRRGAVSLSGVLNDLFQVFDFLKGDDIGFRVFDAPATSALDSVNVVPFTPLNSVPMSQHVTDLHQPFPVRGWLKLAWVQPTATTGAGGVINTVLDLSGAWSAGGKPGPNITRSGNALTVDMSAYHRPPAHGSVIDPQTIVVTFSDVSSVTGRLHAPGTIAWSNNSSWTKS